MFASVASSITVVILVVVAALVIISAGIGSCFTVDQGTVGVITMFGKFRRVAHPGLNFKVPFIERVDQTLSVQNRTAELTFTAVTSDQANVNFHAMLRYAVSDQSTETILKVAYNFVSSQAFMTALTRSIEGTIRSYVATKKQAEILMLRTEIVEHVKFELDASISEWGFHLLDLQMNDISFGQAISDSMERVVASMNERIAAENEGAALLIRETKRAEAEGAAIQIAAQAEMEASRLRGQGVAAFREEVANGMAAAARTSESAGLDPTFVLFSMWTETLRHVAEHGDGNLISFDGTVDGMERSIRQLMMAEHGFVPGTATASHSRHTTGALPTPPMPAAAPQHGAAGSEGVPADEG